MADPTPQKDLEQRALDQVNQGETWFKANRVAIIAVVAALVLGFIIGRIV